MGELITLGDVEVTLVRKAVKHIHLTVHPPKGRVVLAAPPETSTDIARAYAISRLGWIRKQQAQLAGQAREKPRRFVGRESHYVWGRRYLLSVVEKDEKPAVRLANRTLSLQVRPGSSLEKRAEVLHEWHKQQLRLAAEDLIGSWAKRLGVEVSRLSVQRMKTRWGSCNTTRRHIRLNTELVKKPKDLLEYVVLHELLHLKEPNHREAFLALLDSYLPTWRGARAELNELPLGT